MMTPILAFLAASTVPVQFNLAIKSDQRSVLVGEPVRLTAVLTASTAGTLRLDPLSRGRSYMAVRDSDTGSALSYRERGVVSYGVAQSRPLKAGEAVVVNLDFVRGAYPRLDGGWTEDPLFPRPGRYQIRLIVLDGADKEVGSNPLAFDVSAPSGDDAALWRELRVNLRMLDGGGSMEDRKRLQDLIASYPSSPYLRLARLALMRQRALDIHNGIDPDSRESLWNLDAQRREARRKDLWSQLAADLVQERWGLLDDERLALGARSALAAGDEATATRLQSELVARFPKSPLVAALESAQDTVERP